MFVQRIIAVPILAAILIAGCTAPRSGNRNAAWQPLPLRGVSGIALSGSNWLAIGDAKNPGEQRALIIERQPNRTLQTRPLKWVGQEPVDLEAISPVPGNENRFLAVTSKGEWFAVQLGNGTIEVMDAGKLPGQDVFKELEGFSLAGIGNRLVAVWGTRGSNTEPGRIYWSDWTGTAGQPFSPVQSAEIRMPWPTTAVRHISDLWLDPDGLLLISSASDPGDKGPFSSAVWKVGRFQVNGSAITWQPLSKPVEILRDGPDGHKIEAISKDPTGRLVVASDDEALGSAIQF